MTGNERVPLKKVSILLRHGQAEMSAGCCVGQLDVPLSATGVEQVRCLAANWCGATPRQIYCSDLQRAYNSAVPLALALNIPLIPDRRLREIDFGSWEGQEWDDIYQRDSTLMAKWGDDWLNTCPPGGESALQLYTRVQACLQDIEADSLVVAHAGSLRSMQCLLHGKPAQDHFSYAFEHAVPQYV